MLTHHSVLTHRNVASSARSSRIRLLAGVVAALLVTGAPVVGFTITPAHAQVSISVEFRTALQDHGRWQRHSRWGDVWIPADVRRDWRPYTVGHWVYTDDWGWYWVEDEAEASWGWVTNHYGRWVYDDDLGWCWVPGEEWGPAWVQWRRSSNSDVVGWAALPPDDVVVDYRESPRFWVFVRARDFLAPRVASVIVSEREYPTFFRETVLFNRTVEVRDRGRFAVNPGIPAAFIAARVGRPLRTFEVRPRVLAGTAQIPNAVVVREQDLRGGRAFRAQETVRETRTEIRPSRQIAPPRALGANERGRLGDNPPRAARGEQGRPEGREQGTQGRGPVQGQSPEGRGRGEQRLPGTQGRGPGEQKQPPGAQGRGPGEPKRLPGTQGRGPGEQKQLPGTQGRGPGEPKRLPGTQGRGPGEPKQLPGTQGRGPGEQRQLPGTQGRGPGEPKRLPGTQGRGEPRQQLNTEGRGGPREQQRISPEPRGQMRPPSTEGRGGGQPQPQPRVMNRGGGPGGGPGGPGGPAPRTEGRGGGGEPRGAGPAQGPGRGGPGPGGGRQGRPER